MATQIRSSFFLALVLFAAMLVPSQFALAQKFNERAELVGTRFAQPPQQGYAVAVSRDGNTALVGGYLDNSAWVFTLTSAGWTQQGDKLSVDNSYFGISVDRATMGTSGLRGFLPATLPVCGSSKAANWSAPGHSEPQTKVSRSRCPATATPPY
jgi:hypothetical protein